MIEKKNTEKTIFGLLTASFFISVVFLAPADKLEAQFVPVQEQPGANLTANTSLAAKDVGFLGVALDTIAFAAVNNFLQQISSDLIDLAKNNFVENLGDYLSNVGDEAFFEGLDGYLDQSDQPFKEVIAESLQSSYESETEYNYTLDQYVEGGDVDGFLAGDFNKGGWNAWFHLTQNPDNNIFGAYQKTTREAYLLSASRQAETRKDLDWGRGFLSARDEDGNVKTPGSVIESQLNQTLGSGQRRLENADELGEIFSSLFSEILSNLVSDGLDSL